MIVAVSFEWENTKLFWIIFIPLKGMATEHLPPNHRSLQQCYIICENFLGQNLDMERMVALLLHI